MQIQDLVGKTPLVKLPLSNYEIDLYAKLEMNNPTGSVKDRSACYMIDKLLSNEIINVETNLVESSSGNFAISVAIE